MQTDGAEGVAVAAGFGFTVTIEVIEVPAQKVGVGPVGVMVYVAVPAALLLLLESVWAMEVPELVLPPLIVPDCATVHPKVVLPTVLLNEIPVAAPLQIVGAEGVAVATGRGFIVTVAVMAEPTQVVGAGPVGVMVYVAVPAALLLLLVSVCAMDVPEPLLPPLMVADCATVQANVVLPTVLVKAMEGAVALQMKGAEGVAVATGIEFIVTVAVLII